MHTLRLILSDDYTAERSTFLQDEDSIFVATFFLARASARAAVISGVSFRGREGLARLDGNGGTEMAGGRRTGEGARRSTAFTVEI